MGRREKERNKGIGTQREVQQHRSYGTSYTAAGDNKIATADSSNKNKRRCSYGRTTCRVKYLQGSSPVMTVRSCFVFLCRRAVLFPSFFPTAFESLFSCFLPVPFCLLESTLVCFLHVFAFRPRAHCGWHCKAKSPCFNRDVYLCLVV